MGIRSNVGMAVLATGLVTMAVFGYGASQNKAESQGQIYQRRQSGAELCGH
jgi:hypothetical protein